MEEISFIQSMEQVIGCIIIGIVITLLIICPALLISKSKASKKERNDK